MPEENIRSAAQRQAALLVALEKARDVLRSIIRDKASGVHYASAQAACHQINHALQQPAPVAVVVPERSPEDYAIEHAEYMAKSADDVLAKFQAYGLAMLAVDEGGDDGVGELFEVIDTARGDLQESLVDLRSMVYEFRKRSAKTRQNYIRTPSAETLTPPRKP